MTGIVYYVNPPDLCDGCSKPFGMIMYDTKTSFGPWGNFCETCYPRFGVGKLGVGFGQKYQLQPNGRYLKVEG